MTKSEKKIKKYPYAQLGLELRTLRGSRKVKEFAKELGIAPKTYYRYESGERKIPIGLLKLARILTGSAMYTEEHKKPGGITEPRESCPGRLPIEIYLDDLKKMLLSLEDRLTSIESRQNSMEHTLKLAAPASAGEPTEAKEK